MMTASIVRHWEERFEYAPWAWRWRRFFFEDSIHNHGACVNLFRSQTNNGSGNDRGGRLTNRTGFGLMCIVDDYIAIELYVYLDSTATKSAMRACRRIRFGEPADSRYRPGKLQDLVFLNVEGHQQPSWACFSGTCAVANARIRSSMSARPFARCGERCVASPISSTNVGEVARICWGWRPE